MLALWFPLGTLLRQQGQLNGVSAQIHAVKLQQRALAMQQRAISSKAQELLLAREQYQLVQRGQSLIQVLPGRSTGSTNSAVGVTPLVAPSQATTPFVSPTKVTTRTTSGHGLGAFVSRLVRTLEFWR